MLQAVQLLFFFSSSRRHTILQGDWSSDVCSSDLGGMGFVEETGAAQHLRDARIAPIYEGTNGIQAADLVGRKLGLEGGTVLARLLADIRSKAAGEAPLLALVDACEETAAHLASAGADDRLAGSYPFLTMLSVAVSGWLMARQGEAAASSDA